MYHLPDPAIGAVIAALVAALVSLISLVISKENKTSEFRQAWIDTLRAEISAVVAHAWAIHGVFLTGFESTQKLWESARDDFVSMNVALASIKLRLNPNEADCVEILKSLNELEAHMSTGECDKKVIQEIEDRLVPLSQKLLKREWQRVRVGEPFFRIFKFLLIVSVVACLVFLAIKFGAPAASAVSPSVK